jgi:hypothetical protein
VCDKCAPEHLNEESQQIAKSEMNQMKIVKNEMGEYDEELGMKLGLHRVGINETFVGIAIKYNTTTSVLKKLNRTLTDTNLISHRTIKVPFKYGSVQIVNNSKDVELKRAVKRFQILTKCTDYDESLFYVSDSNLDVGSAVNHFRNDITWEKSNADLPKVEKKRLRVEKFSFMPSIRALKSKLLALRLK